MRYLMVMRLDLSCKLRRIFAVFGASSAVFIAGINQAEASLKHAALPWCCPKCFNKGKAALSNSLLAPTQPAGKGQKRRR